MKVLITGANGQVGHELAAVCAAAGDDVVAAGHAELDLARRDQVVGTICELEPEVVVNAGAWTAVDDCEADPGRAYAVNALGVRHVAEGCRRAGAHLLQVSTAFVFDGAKGSPYLEWDEPSPQSVYGRAKLGGEREALLGLPGAAVVRTNWVCGAHGANIVKTILRLAADPDRRLAFVDDQVGQLAFASDLAPLLRRLAVARVPGVFHGTNQGSVSSFELARAVLSAAGHDPRRVDRVSSADLPRPAARPADASLADTALLGLGFGPLPHFSEPLARLVKELL